MIISFSGDGCHQIYILTGLCLHRNKHPFMRFLYVVILCLFIFQVQAQKVVMLQKSNGQQQAFYGNQPLIDAYTAASNEDTIYLPGGSFDIPAIVDKRLTIYGAGHYPDSTTATGKTIIANAFTIGSNADSLHLEGVEFNSDITIGSNVNYLTLKRNSLLSISYSSLPVSSNSRIEANVIRGNINIINAANVLLVNNIFTGQLSNAKNGDVFRNNIFLAYYPLNVCLYALFENNIFLTTVNTFLISYTNNYNTFSNNVFTMTPDWVLNQNYNNYNNVVATNLFINQSGIVFSYSDNYHLQNPGTYVGTDATQCGLYGGIFIYKDGAVPVNPHIRQKTIANTTDVNGKLNITIKVAAQNN